jgi:hypothetical protein
MTAATIYMVKNKMHALASQIYILATGLQNAAPPGTPGKSIQYLFDIATDLERLSQGVENLLPENQQQQLKDQQIRREL